MNELLALRSKLRWKIWKWKRISKSFLFPSGTANIVLRNELRRSLARAAKLAVLASTAAN